MRQASISKYFSSPPARKSTTDSCSRNVHAIPKPTTEGQNIVNLSPLIVIDCSEDAEMVPKHDTSTKLSRNDFSDIVAAAFNIPLRENENPISNDGDQCTSMKLALTPLEKQVENIRKQYPDSLLMVECGYRYAYPTDSGLKSYEFIDLHN